MLNSQCKIPKGYQDERSSSESEFPAGLGKGAGLDWPERELTQEKPNLEEAMILTEKGMSLVI